MKYVLLALFFLSPFTYAQEDDLSCEELCIEQGIPEDSVECDDFLLENYPDYCPSNGGGSGHGGGN